LPVFRGLKMSLLQEMEQFGLAICKQNEKYYSKELDQKTVDTWLMLGTIRIVEYGSENTYYRDQFENEFYCKNYPNKYGKV